MIGSEFLVTGGVQAQATRLLSETVEDGLSSITSESGLKWTLKFSLSCYLMNSGSYVSFEEATHYNIVLVS